MEMKEQPNRALPMQLFPLSIEESKSRILLSPTPSKISGGNKRMECPSAADEHSFMESLSSRGTDEEEDPDVVSDCESGISGSPHREGGDKGCAALENGLIRVHEEDRIHEIVRQKLVAGLGNELGNHTTIEAIHRNAFPSLTKKAKLQAFQIFAKAAAERESGGGNANVRYAWFGASKDEINTIVSHGFLPYMVNDGSYGHGIYLSPDHFPLGSVKSAVGDENGVQHLLLCRVIMGKMEVVASGSGQWHPSRQEFTSGVDDLMSPSKYIVWSSNMNTHILPQYVISFRVSSGVQRNNNAFPVRKPTSPWISFPALISALAKYLPPQTMNLIAKHHKDHRARKISRHEMIHNMRKLAGDDLLAAIIKAHRTKSQSVGNKDSIHQIVLASPPM